MYPIFVLANVLKSKLCYVIYLPSFVKYNIL